MVLKIKLFILFLLFSFAFVMNSKACDCIVQSQLSVKNWNDSELIFKAKLVKEKRNFQFGQLTFQPIDQYKGNVPKEITIFYQTKVSHTLLHAVKDFKLEKEWIVFAKTEKKSGKLFYRLLDSNNSNLCALSRPINTKKTDKYLIFLKDIQQYSNGFQEFFDESNLPIAFGKYVNSKPVGQWVYFDSYGKLHSKGTYLDGKKQDLWQEFKLDFKEKNKLIKEVFFDNGKWIKIIEYNFKGDILIKKIRSKEQIEIYYYQENELIKKELIEEAL